MIAIKEANCDWIKVEVNCVFDCKLSTRILWVLLPSSFRYSATTAFIRTDEQNENKFSSNMEMSHTKRYSSFMIDDILKSSASSNSSCANDDKFSAKNSVYSDYAPARTFFPTPTTSDNNVSGKFLIVSQLFRNTRIYSTGALNDCIQL